MFIDYMKRHQMRVNGCVYCRKIAKQFVKKDTPNFYVMIYLHIGFTFYMNDLVACDTLLAISSKNEIGSI